MQEKSHHTEQNLINELNSLILSIKSVKPSLTEEKIAEAIGYKSGHIAQSRSRGNVSQRFVDSLKQYLARLQNSTPPERTPLPVNSPNYGNETVTEITVSNRILAEANKTFAEAQKVFADAHKTIVENNKELLELAKIAFSFHTKASTDSVKQEPKGEVEKAIDELNHTGRTGAFSQAKKGKQSDS